MEQRKSTILEFLYYCAENPIAYRSQCFVKFFEDGSTSPTDTFTNPVEEDEPVSSSIDAVSFDLSRENSVEFEDEPDSQVDDKPDESSFDPLGTGFDYLYDAAMCFSQAVQEEANLRYKKAFELYKSGIDKLLTGAKSDTNEKRKRIAKTKAGKYLERAELLFENQIANLEEETFLLEIPTFEDIPSVLALERPVNNLSRFKVIGISDYVMRVQDCTDKKFYVLKNVYKDVNGTISLPQSIPFMVKLISYYKTDCSVFLLLPLVSGGLLWDYINNYSNKSGKAINLDEIFVEPPKQISQDQSVESVESVTFDEVDSQSIEIDVGEETFDLSDALEALNSEPVAIPSFDTLSSEMDINDLMSCSQKLLQSVSKTLEKSQIQAKVKSQESNVVEYVAVEDTKDESSHEEIKAEVLPAPLEIPLEHAQLPETVLKQWASELIVAVHSLHKAGIVCGDLNLNNLLLGPKGHLTLTYFHQSERSELQQLCRLNPSAMKCLYVAFDFPLTKASDWYSVGVLIYEIVTRDRFFLNHPMGISRFNEIQFQDPDAYSDDFKDLLHNLIIEKSDKRFSYHELVAHLYFAGVDWSDVEKRGLELFKV